MRILKCHSAENVKGGPLGFFRIQLVQSIKKIKEGAFGGNKKISKKVLQHRKKLKGDPLVSSDFVCYV